MSDALVTAAFIDDIFSIIALVLLINIASGNIGPLTVILPVAYSFAFVVVGGVLALKFWPKVMSAIFRFFPNDPNASYQRSHQVHLVMMCIVLVIYGTIANYNPIITYP
eukprot:gene9756-16030_t